MSLTINMGGGGGTSIMVVGGSTQPTSASEKTIWVNTSTTITSYVFSSAEPSTPVNGMVWIKTSTASPVEFNASNGINVIMIYPSQCKQYESGAWAAKEAKSYLNGSWVTWVVTTYWFTAGTGPTNTWNGYATGDGFTSINTNRIQMTNEYNTSGLVSSSTAIDFTLFSKLHIDADADGSANGTFGLASSIPSGSTAVTFAKSVYQNSRARAMWELDISDMSGSYYIALRASGAGSVFVYNIYAD